MGSGTSYFDLVLRMSDLVLHISAGVLGTASGLRFCKETVPGGIVPPRGRRARGREGGKYEVPNRWEPEVGGSLGAPVG